MAYVTATTGYKAPEINDAGSPVGNSIPLAAIKSERPTSFEGGLKTSIVDNRLYISADVYYTHIKNFQTQSCVFDAIRGLICANVNVPHLNTKGVEMEIFGHPFRYTNLNFSTIYNIAKYPSNFFGADGSDLGGQQLNYAPKFKLTASIEQEFPVSDKYSAVFGGDVTVRTKQSMYLSSSPSYTISGESILNAKIGIRSVDHWVLSFFARNLTNRIYPVQLYPTTAFSSGGLWQVIDQNSRRTDGFQLEAHF